MNLEQFTNASKDLLNQSITLAIKRKNPSLLPVHTLYAGIENDFCRSFLLSLNTPISELAGLVERELSYLPLVEGTRVVMDYEMQTFLRECKQEAEHLNDAFISLEHFLLTWSSTEYLPVSIKEFFKQNNISHKRILEQMKQMRKGKKVESKGAEQQYQVLERYCQDLTKQAQAGKLDPVIGRNDEIRRVIQILSRRTKNNPVLIGEPGVGKTAIVEGIAQRIVDNDVPESLKNNKLLSLDLGLLVAGAKYHGEFEERLKGVLKAVEESPVTIILFIDELHMLVGAGASGAAGGMDASNLLKPALARGTLHCIGATTLKEYKKYIEKDAALERRFQKVMVEEPTSEDAISILRGLKDRYELHHGIRIKDQALIDAVNLSAKHISDRFLPDKAIDLVDEAAAMVKMAIDSHPEVIDQLARKIRQLEIEKVALTKEKEDPIAKKRLEELEKELANLKEDHRKLMSQWQAEKAPLEKITKIKEKIDRAVIDFQAAEREGDYDKASEIIYGKIAKLKQELEEEQKKLSDVKTKLIKQYVDENDIAAVLSRWSGIPVEKLQEAEAEKWLNMENILKEHVIGQDEAIKTISNAMQMHRAGLADPNKPIGSFLFLGPTGVGKTEVARTLADFLFNDPHRMIRIDMSEYMERHAVARLIGAPPGYVGYEEGGQLTEQVRRHPFSIILFDEIEKAHQDVFNIFLQILDEGRLTDSQGRTVSFKNCIIIMTSNIGSDLILQSADITDEIRKQIEDQLYRVFKPEFINRIDAIVFFKRLSQESVEKIAHLKINELQKRLQEKHIKLSISEPAIKELAERGYSPEFGARPLKRVIDRYATIPVSQYILKNPKTKEIAIGIKDKNIVIK